MSKLLLLLTDGGVSNFFRSILLLSVSSLVINRRSWVAALCSAGSRLGVQLISSKNSMVRLFNFWSFSKSWACLDTQCLRTFSTLIVAAVDITDSFRLFLSRQRLSFTNGSLSGGLLEAEVAIANAVAAVDVLLLNSGLILVSTNISDYVHKNKNQTLGWISTSLHLN